MFQLSDFLILFTFEQNKSCLIKFFIQKDLYIFRTLPWRLFWELIALLHNLYLECLFVSLFSLIHPTSKYTLPVLNKRFIDKNCCLGKNLLITLWKGPIARDIYYVWLTIRHMKFSRIRNFRTMFLEQPSVFLTSQREGTSFYFTYARHKI